MATKRSDFMGLWFMPETTPGVDPGIAAAPVVDGTSEAYKYQPDGTYRAWIRMSEKVSGLPKKPNVEIPQIFSRRDYAKCRAQGIEDVGEVTIPFVMSGAVQDYGTTGDTGRTQPPPWLRLMGSALAQQLGRLSTHVGGADTTVDAAVSAKSFSVAAGTVEPGHVVAVAGPGASTSLEIIRPTTAATDTIADAAYHGVDFGLSATPVAGEPVFFATQVACDKQFEAVSESFTLLLQRDQSKASQIYRGARCNGFEITSKVGEIPTIKLNFIYRKFDYVDSALEAEPEYYATAFPCAAVSKNARICVTWDQDADGIVDAADIKRDLEVESFMVKFNAGYTRRKATTTTDGSGIAEIFPSGPTTWEVEFTCVYAQEWQNLVGRCCSAPFGHLTLAYWEIFDNFVRTSDSVVRQGAWFAFFPTLQFIEDPGAEDEVEGIMHQRIRFEAGDWQGDTGSFSTTKHIDTLGIIGVV